MKRIYLFFALFASILSQEAFAISILLDGTQTRLSGTQCQAVTYRFGTQSSYQNQAIDIILEVTAQDNEYSNNKCVDIIDNVVGFRIRDKDSNDDRAYMDIKVTVVKKGTTIPLTVDTITVTNFDLDNNPSYTNTDDVYYKNPSKVYLSEFTNVTQTNGNFFNNYTKKLKGQSTGNCNDNASLLQQECRGGVSFDNTSVFYARLQNDNAYGTYNNANSYRLIQFSFELKDLAPLMSNIQIPCGTVENYSTSSNVWINGTNSSQYTNDLNILKTIKIPNAQNIKVTINGVTESNYDFLYIYDENDIEIYRNSGNFNNIQLTLSGSEVTLKLITDEAVIQSGVTVEIEGLGCTSSGCTENPTAIEVKISHNNDDVEERVSNGDMDMSSTDLEMTQESHQQIVGLRFRNLTIPKGATVTNAYIQFTADETDSGNTNLTIYGEKSDNAQSFSNSDYDVSSRTKTTASSSWSPVAWNNTNEQGSKQKTSDLTAIIQEIIDRDGWNNGNAMAFIISGTGKRVADSYNGSSSKAPYLHIEFNNCSEPTTSTATCYALPDNNSKVYRVLMSPNGSPLPVPTTLNISRNFNGEGSAYRASNHTLYAFTEGSNSDLYTIDLATGNVNKIKDGLLNGSVEGAEFYYDPLQQQEILYVTSEEVNSKLYAFYADTWILLNGYPKNIHGSTTTIDSLAINPINGETYASDDYDYNQISPKLHQLNLQTGETTFKVQVQGTIDAEGLAYASDGNLYVEDEGYFNGRKIYKIDVDTGALTPSALLGGSDDVEGLSCNGTQIAVDYPSLTFTNTSVLEGNSSTTDLTFTITLSKPAVETITFDYTIIDGNTTANQDYIYESNRTITIPKDATTGAVTIRVNGDTDLEEDESFTLQLSNIKNATIPITTIVGTIINDDEPPELKSIGEFHFDNCDEEWKTDYSATNNPIVGGTKISIHKDDDKTYMSDSASSYDNSDAKIPHHTDYEIDKGTLSMLVYDHHNVSTYRYNLLEKGNLVIKTVPVNNDNTKGSIDITLNGHTIHTNEIYWTTQDQGDDFDTQWVHLSFTFGLQGMKLYINGELKGSNSYTGGLSGNSSDFILPNISGYYDELYLFEEQATNTQINELYNNTINNKNIDGTDRVDIPCINIRPITCENSAFMLHDLPTQFSLLNLTTGDMNLQTSNFSSTKINGAGYNKKDGYIWAYDQIKKDGTLLRIGKNQNNEFLNDTFQIPNLNISTYVADIDDNGHFYLKEGGFDSLSVHVIDLDVNSSTYLTKIRTFNLGQKINIHDWAFNPLDDQLYAVAKGLPNNLYKINPNDGVVTLLGDTQINNQSGAFGASFFDKDGRFYAYNNQGGVFVIEPQISPIASLFSNTDAVSKNDGAMCSDAEVVQPPRVYISNEQATEGDSGTTNLTFTISLDKPAGTGVSFDWQVFDGDNSSVIKNAIAPTDYTKLNNPTHVTLNGTTQTYTLSIPIKGDTIVEDDEEFHVTISNIQGAIAGDINATGTILNDDEKLVAEYRMDECDWSTTVRDVFDNSGNNHHATAKGNAKTVVISSKIGRSGSFSGAGDTIEIDDLNLSTPYSVTAWLKSSDNNNSWYHAVIVNDGNNSKFYIDGVRDVTINQNSSMIPTFFTTLNHITFNGQVDEVKFFSTLLKDAQIQTIYDNENAGKDWYTGQVRTAPICISPTNIGEYRFDCFVNGGYPDYSNIENNLSTTIISSTREDSSILCSAVDTNNSSITIPDNNAYHINQGSFSFWLRDKESIQNSGYLVKKSNFKVGFNKINNTTGKIEITLGNGDKITSSSTYNTTSPKWLFITVTFEDAGDIKLYIDSILEAQNSYDNSFNNSSPITLANYSGQFDELYLFEGILSQKRVNDLYNQQKANINLDDKGGRLCECSLRYPFVSISDMSQREGDNGLSTFSLSLKVKFTPSDDFNKTNKNASMRLRLHDGNYAESQLNALVSDNDYIDNGQIIPVPFDSQNIEINISVKGDTKLERDEKFEVEIYDLVNLMATDLRAKVTILNDDMVSLNVERTDSNNNNNQDGTNDDLDKKFNLYTQIAKKDFAYSLVAYDLNDSSKERGISNLTVKVELINQMDSNNSTNVLYTKVHTFDNNQSRIDVPIGNGLSSILSTKYAYFKISYPMDINDTLIPNNNCQSKACLESLASFDHFYSTTSKDGFAIRPAGFKLMLWADDGTIRDHLATSNQNEPYGIALASGYEYELQVQALGDTGLIETNYDPQTLYSNKPANILYPHQEVNATLEFDGNETHCDDVEEKDLKYYDFIEGVNKNQKFFRDNVGNFIIKVKDENWTNTDQSTDNSKRGCIFNSTSNEPNMDGLFGCDIYTTFDIHSVDPLYNHYYDLKVYFQPYNFDVNLTVTSKINSGHDDFIYMSDLSKSKDMSIQIEGDIIAKEKNGKITTNFTKGCFAKPVKLSLDYSMLTDQGEFTNSHPQRIRTSDHRDVVPIQRSVKYGNNNYLTVENSNFLDNNITLSENNFEDNQTGISHLSILYNIKKHLSKSINPIKISLLKANVSSEQAGSNLADNEIRNFTPTGEKDLNTTKTLYFTRVISDRENYPITYGDSESTPLNVEIFCQNNILWCNKMLTNDMNKSNGEYTATNGWYTSVKHNNLFDGGVIKYNKYKGKENIEIINDDIKVINSKDNNKTFTFTKGRIEDLNTSISFRSKQRIDTNITIDVSPWLLYHHDEDKEGKPFWINHFMSGDNNSTEGKLSGVGQAGYILNTEKNIRESSKMSW